MRRIAPTIGFAALLLSIGNVHSCIRQDAEVARLKRLVTTLEHPPDGFSNSDRLAYQSAVILDSEFSRPDSSLWFATAKFDSMRFTVRGHYIRLEGKP